MNKLSIQTTQLMPEVQLQYINSSTAVCVAVKPYSYHFKLTPYGPLFFCIPGICQRKSKTQLFKALTHILNPVGMGLLGIVTASETLPWKPWIYSLMVICVPGIIYVCDAVLIISSNSAILLNSRKFGRLGQFIQKNLYIYSY